MIRNTLFRGREIFFSDHGHGPAIVFLHGFLEDRTIWDAFAAPLVGKYRVIAIDLPGFGKTPSLGYIHTMELMAECIKAVMDSLSLKKYILVGHSMGGYVTLAFAELFPKQPAGFCLFHSTAMPDSEARKGDRDKAIDFVKKYPARYIKEVVPKYFATHKRKPLQKTISRLVKSMSKTKKEGIVAALLGMKKRPNRELTLKHTSVPVLFIIGKHDSVLAWENILLLTSLPKKSFSLILEDAGHMGLYESPSETLEAIDKFAGYCFKNN